MRACYFHSKTLRKTQKRAILLLYMTLLTYIQAYIWQLDQKTWKFFNFLKTWGREKTFDNQGPFTNISHCHCYQKSLSHHYCTDRCRANFNTDVQMLWFPTVFQYHPKCRSVFPNMMLKGVQFLFQSVIAIVSRKTLVVHSCWDKNLHQLILKVNFLEKCFANDHPKVFKFRY